MTWESFYLVCFVGGFTLSVLGLLAGAFHWSGLDALHLPHPDAHGLHIHAGGHGASVSPWNFATLMAFLAWFGGMGYLLTGRGHLGHLLVLAVALMSGVGGAAVVFVFLTKVLMKHERFLDAADFEMTGVLGRVTVPLRPGGTGEIVYSQAGTRRSAGARSESGAAIPRDCEVVVTRYEKGIAWVRPWEELAGSGGSSEADAAEGDGARK